MEKTLENLINRKNKKSINIGGDMFRACLTSLTLVQLLMLSMSEMLKIVIKNL
jgi:hypothetical protein